MMRPIDPSAGSSRTRCKIPVKIVTADGGKEYKTAKTARWGRPQKQPACLPDHDNGTDGDIQAAENKVIDDSPKHAVSYGFRIIIWGDVMVSAELLSGVIAKNLNTSGSF